MALPGASAPVAGGGVVTDPAPTQRLAAAIAQAATREDPSLPTAIGYRLALSTLAEMRVHPTATPAALARRLLVRHPGTDPSWANHVARVAVLRVTRG